MFVQMKQRQEAGETSKKPFDMQLERFPTEVLKYELKENIYFVSDSKIVFLVFSTDCRINMLRTSLSLSTSINSNSGILGIHQKNFLFPRYILF